MKNKLKKSEGIKAILSLHKPRYASSPNPDAERHDAIMNMYLDALERGLIPPDTSFDRFEKEIHDFDYDFSKLTRHRRYAAKDEPPPRFDLNRPVKPQDYADLAVTLGSMDNQGLEALRFMLDKLKEQYQK